jgi:dihydrolipoamide dehydrogenase
MYKQKHKKPSTINYDYVIIGSGSGGGVAAHMLARAGKSVAIVEQEKVGGECPNFGCVPTKALLQSAEVYNTLKEAHNFGIEPKAVSFNYPKIRAWKTEAVENTGVEDGRQAFKDDNIDVLVGHAHFISPWILNVGGKRVHANTFLIATGTHDVVPPIQGLKEAGYWTYRHAIEQTKPPKRLFVIGGGAIGLEFAHLFQSFESEVTIAEFAPRLLIREDEEMGELVKAIFESRGATVLTSTKVTSVKKNPDGSKSVTYETDGVAKTKTVDEILLAAGKAPNADLGLENAGVVYTNKGITVNEQMQTNVKHIYACGDVTGMYMFTHTASYQSRIAAHNMLHRAKRGADYTAIPRCVYLSPECAAVGATEYELQERKVTYHVGAVPISMIGRANTSQEDTGYVKVLASKNGQILGASIVSPRAGEMIHELTLAVKMKLTVQDINWTVHAFPTWSEAVRLACAQIA